LANTRMIDASPGSRHGSTPPLHTLIRNDAAIKRLIGMVRNAWLDPTPLTTVIAYYHGRNHRVSDREPRSLSTG
jgi:hypothetical protein